VLTALQVADIDSQTADISSSVLTALQVAFIEVQTELRSANSASSSCHRWSNGGRSFSVLTALQVADIDGQTVESVLTALQVTDIDGQTELLRANSASSTA